MRRIHSTAPRPNLRAIAAAAMSVASPSRKMSRASSSFRSGVRRHGVSEFVFLDTIPHV